MGEFRSIGTAFEFIPGTGNHHQIWLPKTHFIFKMLKIVLFLSPQIISSEEYGYNTDKPVYKANFKISYTNPNTNRTVRENFEGRFGIGEINKLKLGGENGRVVIVRTVDNKVDGCSEYNMMIPSVKWVALIERGECPFQKKIEIAKKYNASAVVIYNNVEEKEDPHIMEHTVEEIVAVSIAYKDGINIQKLVEHGYNVTMVISVGQQIKVMGNDGKNPSKTSVVFVSVSFIVLMIISLAWLVFYYIQRFRYAHAKERLAEMSADFDQHAVCIEGYKTHDVIRTLPCKETGTLLEEKEI